MKLTLRVAGEEGMGLDSSQGWATIFCCHHHATIVTPGAKKSHLPLHPDYPGTHFKCLLILPTYILAGPPEAAFCPCGSYGAFRNSRPSRLLRASKPCLLRIMNSLYWSPSPQHSPGTQGGASIQFYIQ